jgi:hypothetical protein
MCDLQSTGKRKNAEKTLFALLNITEFPITFISYNYNHIPFLLVSVVACIMQNPLFVCCY